MFSKLKSLSSSTPVSGPVEYLVAGLGNPGKEYENTRHNAGFMSLDYIAKEEGVSLKKLQFRSLCGDCMLGGKRVFLMKPSTYMNKSGEAIRDAMQFYKIPIEKVLILCDDISLEVGKMRVRRKGSDGGQKGLANIIYLTGKNEFPRIRIGVGKKPYPDMDLADWVLSRFNPADLKEIEALYPNIHEAVKLIVAGDIESAMAHFN